MGLRISHHIPPIVINSLRGGHTHTCMQTRKHTHAHTQTFMDRSNSKKPGDRLARALFKNFMEFLLYSKMNNNSCIKGDGSAIIYSNKTLII